MSIMKKPAFTCDAHTRPREAYVEMANKLKYRPAASGDGMGNIYLSGEQLADAKRLAEEAAAYAQQFVAEEDECCFRVGISDYRTSKALVYAIEAARLLCAGCGGWETEIAIQLLEMARDETQRAWREEHVGQHCN